MDNNFYLAVASLVVAALAAAAAIVTPFTSWWTTRHQTDSAERIAKYQADLSQRVALMQIISPMRQAWIDLLRNRVAELFNEVHWYYRSTFEKVTGDEHLEDAQKRAMLLLHQIHLMLNLKEEDHDQLFRKLGTTIEIGLRLSNNRSSEDLSQVVAECSNLCQRILKREWDRVKKET